MRCLFSYWLFLLLRLIKMLVMMMMRKIFMIMMVMTVMTMCVMITMMIMLMIMMIMIYDFDHDYDYDYDYDYDDDDYDKTCVARVPALPCATLSSVYKTPVHPSSYAFHLMMMMILIIMMKFTRHPYSPHQMHWTTLQCIRAVQTQCTTAQPSCSELQCIS